MLKKINLPILLMVMAVLMFVVVLSYEVNTGQLDFLKNKNQKQKFTQTTTVPTQEPKIVRTDYTDVARKTLDWIDKQRNEDGWYILARVCGQKDCEAVWDDKETGNKDGLIATLARLNFYEQQQDPKDLEIVKKDIDKFWEKYKDKDLSDSLWLCKITYEMSQSKYIDKEQKDKLKKLCLKKKFLEKEEIKKYWGERFKRTIEITYSPISWTSYSLQERYFDIFFGSITDLVYRNLWFDNEGDVSLINDYFLEIDSLLKNKKSLEPQNVCLFGISTLDMYKNIGESENKLDYSVGLYNQFGINNDKYFDNPICGLFTRELFELTSEEKYLDKLNNSNNLIIKNNQRIERDASGEGFVRSDLSREGFNPGRNIVENGIIVELIRK
jgi:hypothetical protein